MSLRPTAFLGFAAVPFAAALVLARTAGAAPTPAPSSAVHILDQNVVRPLIAATATPAPAPSPTPLPTALTLSVQPAQGPAIAGVLLSDYQFAGSETNGRTTTQASFALPPGAVATELEQFFVLNETLRTVNVFVPPSTLDTFTNAAIVDFKVNAGDSHGRVRFTLQYERVTVATVSPPTPAPFLHPVLLPLPH